MIAYLIYSLNSLKPLKSKGLIGHTFTVCICTENENQVSFCPLLSKF